MTTAAICAAREFLWNPSYYRGEQYDTDLGLYYLRARYYNQSTGRFMSKDPNAGYIDRPTTLHKYLYAGGDPVNGLDPSGRDAILQFLFTSVEITTTVPAQLWYTCAVVTAYSLVSDTLEVLGGELAAKAVPTLPKLIQVGCGWIAVAGVI
jgi:RHS repeat-associated protein